MKLVNYWNKYTEMHGQQNVKIYIMKDRNRENFSCSTFDKNEIHF